MLCLVDDDYLDESPILFFQQTGPYKSGIPRTFSSFEIAYEGGSIE
jgi:hypothetical protein